MKKDIKLIFEEIEKHKSRMEYSKKKIESWELSEELLENPEIIETIDSFIFRFSKMQDTMGQKLFPLVLEIMGEESRNKPFIDILNKLEQLEVIPCAEEWKRLREIRNTPTHTYPWERKTLLEGIRKALKASDYMVEVFERVKERIKPYVERS